MSWLSASFSPISVWKCGEARPANVLLDAAPLTCKFFALTPLNHIVIVCLQRDNGDAFSKHHKKTKWKLSEINAVAHLLTKLTGLWLAPDLLSTAERSQTSRLVSTSIFAPHTNSCQISICSPSWRLPQEISELCRVWRNRSVQAWGRADFNKC